VRETYPVQWSQLLATSTPKAIPLTLSTWFGYAELAAGTSSVVNINNLGGVPQWLLTQGSLYNEYRFMADPILHWVPAGGTQQTGQISFGLLRDPNDLFRGSSPTSSPSPYQPLRNSNDIAITATDVLTMEHSYAGPVSLPFSHRFALQADRRLRTWMRQDASLVALSLNVSTGNPAVMRSIPNANTRMDSPFGAICIQCDSDIFTNTNLGRLFIEYDIEFRSRVIPGLQASANPAVLTATSIPPNQLHSGKTLIGLISDPKKESGQKSYKHTTQLVDPVVKCKLVASNHLFVQLDFDRIEGTIPLIRIISDKHLQITSHNGSLSLPKEEEYNGFYEWQFTFIPLSNDLAGLDIKSDGIWSGELLWSSS
jgi:hypothetical protein